MRHPTFPDAQSILALGAPCCRCEQPIDGLGYETMGSDGRQPTLLLYCAACLERARAVYRDPFAPLEPAPAE